MPVPLVYRKSGEKAVASYSYTDIAAGTGVVVFSGGISELSGAPVYRLSKNVYNCATTGVPATVKTDRRSTTTGWYGRGAQTSRVNETFDTLEFKLPQVVGGEMLITIPFGVYNKDTASGVEVYAIVTVSKVGADASVTQLAQGYSPYMTITNAGIKLTDSYVSVKLDIAETNFEVGSKIRVNYNFFGCMQIADGWVGITVAHDPRSEAIAESAADYRSAFTAGHTALEVFVPFKIDL